MEAEVQDEAATGTQEARRQDGKDGRMDLGGEAQSEQVDGRPTVRERKKEKAEKVNTPDLDDAEEEAQGDHVEHKPTNRDRKKEKVEKADRGNIQDPDEAEDCKAIDCDLVDRKPTGKATSKPRRPQTQTGGASAACAEQWGQTLRAIQAQLERLATAQEDIQQTLSMLTAGRSMVSMGQSPAVSSGARISSEKIISKRKSQLEEEQPAKVGFSVPEEDMRNEFAKEQTLSKHNNFLPPKDRTSVQVRELAAALTNQVETQTLKSIFVEANRQTKQHADYKSKTRAQRFNSMSIDEKANVVDAVMGCVILLNMVVIGLSMDMEGDIFFFIDLFLTLIFICEIVIKVSLYGIIGHFWPTSIVLRLMSWSDAAFIFVDLMQLTVQLANLGADKDGSSVRTSVLRVYRLLRLARFIRLLRMEAFRDLMMMVIGLLKGMPTLLWAMLLLLIIFYVLALAGRLALGSGGPIEIRQEFESVDRALFAIFRCSFGDCTANNGVSLHGMVIEHYGMLVGMFGCLVIFFVTIGMFNVISAIFVQGTMSAWHTYEEREKMSKLNNFSRFSENMTQLLVQVFERSHDAKAADVFRIDSIEEWKNIVIPHADFKDACVHDERVRATLRELDIIEWDLPVLADILDPQNDHALTVMGIMHGIVRLRGDPRRSDIVTIDMMVREVQKSIGKVLDRLG